MKNLTELEYTYLAIKYALKESLILFGVSVVISIPFMILIFWLLYW